MIVVLNKHQNKELELTEQQAFKIFYQGAETFFVGLADETQNALETYKNSVKKYDRYTSSAEYNRRLKDEFRRRLFEEKEKFIISICNNACDKYKILKIA